MSDDSRLAVLEERTDKHEAVITKLDDAITQIKIYTESSQRLLESHEKGMVESHKRELSRDQKSEMRFENMTAKIHQMELDNQKSRSEDRANFEAKLKEHTSTNTKRLNVMEQWKWKIMGGAAVVAAAASYVIPQLLKMAAQ